ncbi:MAG: hypothetical protein Q8Q60_04835 [Candidatus Chromulinivorax sp.]|nr:hypothetical protein [Candidatus Chromulinivorax sp.]
MATKKYSLVQFLNQGSTSNFDLYLVTTEKQLQAVAGIIKKAKSVCINIQGTNLDPELSVYAGMSLAVNQDVVYFIPRNTNDATEPSLTLTDVVAGLQPVLADNKIEKIMYNILFNQAMLEKSEMLVAGKIFDITTAASLVMDNSKQETIELLKSFYHISSANSYQEMMDYEKTQPNPFLIEQGLWQNISDTHQTIVLSKILKAELQCLLDKKQICKHE